MHQVLLLAEDVLQQRVGHHEPFGRGNAVHLQVGIERFTIEFLAHPGPCERLTVPGQRQVLHEVRVEQAVGLGVLVRRTQLQRGAIAQHVLHIVRGHPPGEVQGPGRRQVTDGEDRHEKIVFQQ